MENQDQLIINSGPEAIGYLVRRGYTVSKSKFYRDLKKGLIRRKKDKTYATIDLERYARQQGLAQPDLSGPRTQKIEELHEIKLQKEVEKLDWENKRRKFEYDREQGKYIPRELLELELASRAAVIDSQLRTKIRARAREWTALVHGRTEFVPDLVSDALAMLDQAMNEYARMDRFQVIFGNENEELEDER